jgi:hypothetical protein
MSCVRDFSPLALVSVIPPRLNASPRSSTLYTGSEAGRVGVLRVTGSDQVSGRTQGRRVFIGAMREGVEV